MHLPIKAGLAGFYFVPTKILAEQQKTNLLANQMFDIIVFYTQPKQLKIYEKRKPRPQKILACIFKKSML
jgi:hypothetical protein